MEVYIIVDLVKYVLKDIPSSDFVKMEISEKLEILYKRVKEKDWIPQLLLEMKSDIIALCTIEFMEGLHLSFVENINKYNYGITHAETDELKSTILYERAKYLFKHRLYNEFEADLDRALTLDSLANNQAEIEKMKKQAFRLKKVYNRPFGKFYQDLPTIDEINPKVPNASASIKIAIDNINGKHIVATKNIKAGQVLVVEKPFSATCDISPLQPICHECFQRCYNLLPCDNCVYHFYCSDACKTAAWNTYHKYMCPLMKSLDKVCKMLPGALLALKITIINHAEHPNIDNYEDIDVDNEEYSSTSFRVIWKSANKLEDVQYEKQIVSSYITVLFYEWLITNTDFFEDFQATVNKKSFMKVLFTMLNTVDDSFPIGYINGVAFDHTQCKRMGFGLYSVGRIFNHSCCPNVYHTFHGSTVVMRAIRSIKAGEQCCISYSFEFLYFMSEKNARQELIDYCQFKCRCEACLKNWPALYIQNNEPWIKFQRLIVPNFLKGDVKAAKATLSKLLKKLEKFESKEPNKSLAILQCLIRICFRILGNNNCALNDI